MSAAAKRQRRTAAAITTAIMLSTQADGCSGYVLIGTDPAEREITIGEELRVQQAEFNALDHEIEGRTVDLVATSAMPGKERDPSRSCATVTVPMQLCRTH